ncbi:carboxymuconolactone decarboxylase family protein [Microbacterium sp.]|uniref:carboxymuconolactone decarboxylase family protein n=1 Tax=Microbacterium sp. TaxID=51671 RepID=UPI0037CBF263
MALTARQQEIKAEFERVHGAWDDSWQAVLALDPEFLAAYLDFAGVPHRKQHLDAKTRAFMALAVDAATTHLHGPGIRRHIEAARAAGATAAEIMEVLECTATLSIHAMNVGVPVLVEVLEERGERPTPAPLTEYQEHVKEEFTRDRGYWNPTWDEMLEFDPELLEAYTTFSAYPWRHGSLSPKLREFVYIAFDTSSTHLYRVGLKLHIENALGYGATPQEILEIMEIASTIGMHSVTTAAPILLELATEG